MSKRGTTSPAGFGDPGLHPAPDWRARNGWRLTLGRAARCVCRLFGLVVGVAVFLVWVLILIPLGLGMYDADGHTSITN